MMSPLPRSVHSTEVVPSQAQHGLHPNLPDRILPRSLVAVLQVGSQQRQEDKLSLCFMPLASKSWGTPSDADRT